MPEVLPSTATPYDVSISEIEVINDSFARSITESGPVAAIEARRLYYRSLAAMFNSQISSIVFNSMNGRATLTVSYEQKSSSDFVSSEEDGYQELQAIDIVRDIKSAPYFASLSSDDMALVQSAWDARLPYDGGWPLLMQKLYGHMAFGQEQYIDTTYEFRHTFVTSSSKTYKKAASNPNTVQDLPTLNTSLKNLIDTVPTDGEWLKKPVIVQYNGRKGWTITMVYQWAKQWSVIYGGSFTGI